MAQWRMPPPLPGEPVLERVLTARGLSDPGQREAFLNPDYSRHLHDPFLFQDMERAVERIHRAIKQGETILVAADYDADGVTAAALLHALFDRLSYGNVRFHIPHRLRDGYGLVPYTVAEAARQDTGLIITVDNGITANEAVEQARQCGIDVIITDHHQPPEQLPPAFALIDPWVAKDRYPYPYLSGVGLAFKLAQAVLARRPDQDGDEAFLKWQLDLVALGTVADVSNMTGENRVLVYYGLKVLGETRRPGLRALKQLSCEGILDTESIGFRLGPRINAAGRLDSAEKAFLLLTSGDPQQAELLARELDQLNTRRRSMVQQAVREAAAQAELQCNQQERALVVDSANWHPGIVGLVAGNLSEKYRMPSIAMSNYGEENMYVGSCRSLPGFDVAESLMHFSSFFTRSGGHAQAGGFSMPRENLPLFRESFFSHTRSLLQDGLPDDVLAIDSSVSADELTLETCRQLRTLFPFGPGNPEPVLLLQGARLLESRTVGSDGRHLRVVVDGAGPRIGGIGFSMGDKAAQHTPGDAVDLVFYLRENHYNGRTSPQLNLLDIRAAVPD